MGFWKDTFNTSNYFPHHGNPNIFISSEWQRDKESPSIIYLVLRLLIFCAFFSILILSYTKETDEGKQKWAIYLTNWGLTICTIQSFLSSLMLFCVVLGTRAFDAPQLVETILKAYQVYWVANVIATTVAFTISFVYWALIHKPEYWSIMNFMVHGMNSILMFIDFCVVAQPVRLLHFYYPIIFTMLYLTMSGIYFALGFTAKGGEKYIYPILKWDQPGTTLGYCVAIMILITLIHAVTFFLQLGRSKIAELCFGSNEKDENIGEATIQML